MKRCEGCGASEIVAGFCAYCGSLREQPAAPVSYVHEIGELIRWGAGTPMPYYVQQQALGMQNAYAQAYQGKLSPQAMMALGGIAGAFQGWHG